MHNEPCTACQAEMKNFMHTIACIPTFFLESLNAITELKYRFITLKNYI